MTKNDGEDTEDIDYEARCEDLEKQLEIVRELANSLFEALQTATKSANKEMELFRRRVKDMQE